ncbi:ribonuclease H-like domain, reverse transcriptase, RNA-dependent DNA polymerase [Tanacetum coccineum]
MKSRFQTSSMGELTFFLRLQVKQKEDGIFISQDKYVAEILKKFDFASVKTVSTPIETQKPLVKDKEATDVDPDPSPRPSPSISIPDSNPEGSGGNYGGQSSSDKSLSGNKDGLTLQSVYDLCVSLCKQSVSMKTRLVGKKSMQKKWMQKESVSKQGRKTAKSKPTAHKDQTFDDLDDLDALDYMETEDAHNEKGVSTEDQVSTVNPDEAKNATLTVFGDDETIAEFLVSMSQNKANKKGVEIKDAEDSDRPRPTSTRSMLTLKPLPKIDPKDKGKKVLEEEADSEAESEGVNKAERKFAQLVNDEEIARKVQKEWETEEEKKKLAEAEATKAALIRDYDDIQARIEIDSILAARLQEEERENVTPPNGSQRNKDIRGMLLLKSIAQDI